MALPVLLDAIEINFIYLFIYYLIVIYRNFLWVMIFLCRLQQEDAFCKNILNQIEKGNIIDGQLYLVKDKILNRYVLEGNNTYETIVVPKALTA